MRHASRLAGDDVVVGQDVAVAADDDAGAEAVLDAAPRSEEIVGVAEEREERIARHLPPDDLLRRDVDDGGDRPLGDAAEVGEVAGGADRPRRGDRRSRGAAAICAPASVASRSLPATSRPAAKAREQDQAEVNRPVMKCSVLLRDVDAAAAAVGRLRARHGQHAVAQIRGDAIRVNRNRKLERAAEAAVAALDAVVFLTGVRSRRTPAMREATVVVHRDRRGRRGSRRAAPR